MDSLPPVVVGSLVSEPVIESEPLVGALLEVGSSVEVGRRSGRRRAGGRKAESLAVGARRRGPTI